MNNSKLLQSLYTDIQDIILSRQNPVTGLLPASTAINSHGDYTDAWVRDNVYSILSVWSLSMAYKRHGDRTKQDELEQATIKLMRGLLNAMMRQSDKVEAFKHSLSPMDCLHAKYDTKTALPIVGDDEWGHLQIDATSIFLLMVAQMSASGLRIINTIDEVDFIQNLIYYIAFAYRIPDYGIWERGNKINNGKTEINASSVGMAKAALEALDGFNLFGKDATPRAIVHTVPDGISRARNTLARLLPRESVSKEVDSALLSVIGFPAFAVGDQKLVKKTRDKILSDLGGEYGCKRFLWDGHQTVVEDHHRIHYEHAELANFANIESEWPLFYTYLYIQSLFEQDTSAAKQYRDKLESLMIEKDGKGLLPELYFVTQEHIDAERENPKSQPRQANDNLPLVWAQSLYFTGLMLDEGLVDRNDLDPLRLQIRASSNKQNQVALVVLAENDSVKRLLADNGVIAESLKDIAPLKVISAPELVQTYRQLGANQALGLTGRPKRRFQGLATAQTYNINQQQYLCLSSLQYDDYNYRMFDAHLASQNLLREVGHIEKHWINREVAVFNYMVTQHMCEASDTQVLLDTIKSLQLRTELANVGYASASLAYRASRQVELILPDYQVTAVCGQKATATHDSLTIDLSRLPAELTEQVKACIDHDEACVAQVSDWLKRYQLDTSLQTSGDTISFDDLLADIYQYALHKTCWLTARHIFAIRNWAHKDLADDLSLLCARHLSLVLGQNEPVTLAGDHAQLKPKELTALINQTCPEYVERTLIQELLVNLGNTMRTNTQNFSGLRSIKLHQLLALCAGSDSFDNEVMNKLGKLSPFELYQSVKKALDHQQQSFDLNVEFSFNTDAQNPSNQADAMAIDWKAWRTARGLITRFDDDFLTAIWQSLAHTNRLVFADHPHSHNALESEFIRSSMTPREESFAHKLDELSQNLHPIYYKSAMIEVLYCFTQYCKNTPDCQFDQVVLGDILSKAAQAYTNEQGRNTEQDTAIDLLIEQPNSVLNQYVVKVLAG
ncbi:phosphorylase kinase [Catenovulum sp. SM1970]|uniref:glycoside hydrolase family 15 protein n=1 Tax=Marinifaba aquimaris TaxID=2741323 RepID=UPI001574687A|nr:glycoside hydrolase family 15 protein [Marinifaba aquimaris]NTS78171.1 phosphorylase kinase [Marinifaba aquimaris]